MDITENTKHTQSTESTESTVITTFIGHTPEETWLGALSEQMGVEPAPIVKKRTRRLRRMQSQNFVQRAVHNVVELFRGEREVA